MTVGVRSCRRRRVQSATIYFCLLTLRVLPGSLAHLLKIMRDKKETRVGFDEWCRFMQNRF